MKSKEISVFSTMKRLYLMSIKACPISMLAYSAVLFLNGISGVFVTYGTQGFFDEVEQVSKAHLGVTGIVLLWFAFLMSVILLGHILNGFDNYLGDYLHIWLKKNFLSKLHMKVDRIEPIKYEDPIFLDNVNKAINGSGTDGCTFALEAFMVVLFSNLPYVVLMSVYLFRLQPLLVVSIFLVFIPILISQYIRIEIFTKLEDTCARSRRESIYYQGCICDPAHFKETRLLGAYRYFMEKYKSAVEDVNKNTWKSNCKIVRIELLMRVITLLGYLGVLLLLVYYVIHGSITIGAFAAVFLAVSTIFQTFECAVVQQIGGVNDRIGIVKNYIRFLGEEERSMRVKEEAAAETEGIVAQDVSFSYINSDTPALRNINLDIKGGEMIAIVGANGAGKSTLVKLLIGSYKPSQGLVRIKGTDTDSYDMNQYQKTISGVFQDFQRYKMSLSDNITISSNSVSQEEVRKTADEIGISLDRDVTLHTMLSKEFGGVELSGGQWQRVAIARGLYRTSDIIVLDEPTAAIDPLEETRIYKKFAELAKGKTAILVTHRMGSCRIADRIVVMDAGSIVEVGTHEELMGRQGKYHEMYTAQAKWY